LRRHLATRCLRAWCALLSITYDIRWVLDDEEPTKRTTITSRS
jgi:hypothetical protein